MQREEERAREEEELRKLRRAKRGVGPIFGLLDLFRRTVPEYSIKHPKTARFPSSREKEAELLLYTAFVFLFVNFKMFYEDNEESNAIIYFASWMINVR